MTLSVNQSEPSFLFAAPLIVINGSKIPYGEEASFGEREEHTTDFWLNLDPHIVDL